MALQLRSGAHEVGEEQRVGLDQHGLALGMRAAGDRGAGKQAGREGVGDGAAGRRVGLRDIGAVARNHLHLVVQTAELDDVFVTHQPAEQTPFTDAGLELGREEIRLVQRSGQQFDPHLVVTLPCGEKALSAGGAAHHVVEGAQAAGAAAHTGRRGRGLGGGARGERRVGGRGLFGGWHAGHRRASGQHHRPQRQGQPGGEAHGAGGCPPGPKALFHGLELLVRGNEAGHARSMPPSTAPDCTV